ncbi:MAG: 5-oxoprolinase subunit PxpA [Flavobacteriaceae bacterium]|nr:5-oxoprolinase subunit PxpA [Flavobacteriaceae bacterium]
MYTIDINSDLGEGTGNDEAIMPLVSSCSIACGGHYGDEGSMRKAVKLAKKHNTKIGAHPSFPDKDHFGRKILTLTKSELYQSIFEQLLHFFAICETEGSPIHHIKLHGALYHYAAKDAPTADAVVEAIVATKIRPKLYVPFNSVLGKKAENLLPLAYEAFIDRRYLDDLSLAPRQLQGAVIHDPEDAWLQLKQMVEKQEVTALSGKNYPITASTYCIHGDHEHSVVILNYIREQMKNHSIHLAQ